MIGLASLVLFPKALAFRGWRRIYFFRNGIRVAWGSYVDPRTTIGRGTRINAPSHIGECVIGRYCAIGGRLVIRSTDHFSNFLNMQEHFQRRLLKSEMRVSGKGKGKVVIGNGVWFGDSVIVLPGVTVGDGAVVGAGSVLTKSVPPYSVAVGNPAKVIKMRFSEEMISVLREFPWWLLDEKVLRNNKHLFEVDLTSISASNFRDAIRASGLMSDAR